MMKDEQARPRGCAVLVQDATGLCRKRKPLLICRPPGARSALPPQADAIAGGGLWVRAYQQGSQLTAPFGSNECRRRRQQRAGAAYGNFPPLGAAQFTFDPPTCTGAGTTGASARDP